MCLSHEKIPYLHPMHIFWFLILLSGPALPAAAEIDGARAVVRAFAEIAAGRHEKATQAVQHLHEALALLMQKREPSQLPVARQAWRQARSAVLRLESLRFFFGPIDDDDGPQARLDTLLRNEGKSVEAMIAREETFPDLTAETLQGAHLSPNSDNVLCGLPVLEYFLWHREPLNLTPRRASYLAACAQLLNDDVEAMAREWQAGKLGNYRAMFEEAPDQSLQRILTGMSLLSGVELAASRLQMALDTRAASEIPASRSGTTKEDLLASTEGLKDFWQALQPMVVALDAALAAKMEQQFQASARLAKALPEVIADAVQGAEAAPGRVQITELMLALEAQAESLRIVGRRCGFILPVEIMLGDE